MKFKITINDIEHHAEMIDNELVKQIANMCPFESNFKQHNDVEYFTKLPGQANDDGCQLTTKLYKNRIYYYQNWNAMTIVYEDVDVSPYELVEIGEFEEDVSEFLKSKGRNVLISCEVIQ